MSSYFIAGERVIAAPRQQLFDLVATPSRHREFDGSGTVQGELGATPGRLKLGSKFEMSMRKGIGYRMTSTVVEFEDGYAIAWKPLENYTWRYTFQDVPGGTLVTEEWDARKFKMRFAFKLFGITRATERAITTTLQELAKITEAGN